MSPRGDALTKAERRCLLTVSRTEAGIKIEDFVPRPRSSSATYNRISPVRIPAVRVAMDVGDDTEEFSLRMPAHVSARIPLLHGLAMAPQVDSAGEAGGSGDMAVSCDLHAHAPGPKLLKKRLDLPGTIWDFLTVLKVMLDPDWDGDTLFLDDDLLALANALQVCFVSVANYS